MPSHVLFSKLAIECLLFLFIAKNLCLILLNREQTTFQISYLLISRSIRVQPSLAIFLRSQQTSQKDRMHRKLTWPGLSRNKNVSSQPYWLPRAGGCIILSLVRVQSIAIPYCELKFPCLFLFGKWKFLDPSKELLLPKWPL